MSVLVLKALARQDLNDAKSWYDVQQTGLGLEFLDEFGKAASMIERFPTAFREVRRGVRCASVKRFPYFVFYRVDADRLIGLAIVHQHRDPDVWKSRVR